MKWIAPEEVDFDKSRRYELKGLKTYVSFIKVKESDNKEVVRIFGLIVD